MTPKEILQHPVGRFLYRIRKVLRKIVRPTRRFISPYKRAFFDLSGIDTLRNAILVHVRLRRKELRLFKALDAKLLKIKIPGDYYSCNPSLVATPDDFKIVTRTSNYRLLQLGGFIRNGDRFDSRNYLSDVSRDMSISNTIWLDDTEQRRQVPEAYNGFEDPRLIEWDGNLWILVNACNQPAGRNQMFLGKLVDNEIAEFYPLPSPFGLTREKNWMPFVLNNQLFAIHSLNPLRVLRLSPAGAELIWERELNFPQTLFGSSQLVPWKDGLLCVVHYKEIDKKLFYLHQFLYFDKNWQPRLSKPFFWKEYGVEFCCGLAAVPGEIVVGCGVYDREAYIAKFDENKIAELLGL